MSEKNKFTLDEIGKEWLKGLIVLKKDFVQKYLSDFLFQAPFFKKGWGTNFLSNIYCPYCYDGVLTLIEKKRNICETHVCHTGNSYSLQCSKHCQQIIFTYNNTWLYC